MEKDITCQYAPVILFIYNRKDKAKKILDSLMEVDLIEGTDLFIFSDGPKDDNDSTKIEEVRSTVERSNIKKRARSVKIIKRVKNIGLANSIISGVTEVIDQYEKVIVVEDDNIVSKDFLQYMNYCLDHYEDRKEIGSIAGLSSLKIDDFPYGYKYDVYLLERICSFAWGTWKSVWDQVDWEVKDYSDFKKDRKLRDRFDETGNTHSYLLDAQMYGRVDSWAIRFDYSLFKNGYMTLYPRYSKTKNIGYDGSGTHYDCKKKLNKWEFNISNINFSMNKLDEIWECDDLTVNKSIQNVYCRYNDINRATLILKRIKMYIMYLIKI